MPPVEPLFALKAGTNLSFADSTNPAGHALQTDPIDEINIAGDSTLALFVLPPGLTLFLRASGAPWKNVGLPWR